MTIAELMALDVNGGKLPMTKDARPVKAFLQRIFSKTTGMAGNKMEFKELFFGAISSSEGIEQCCPGAYKDWNQALVVKKLAAANGLRVNEDKIRGNLDDMNAAFRSKDTALYIQSIWDLGNLPSFAAYQEALLGPWRTMTAIKQIQGQWQNADWEMYLHWVKLCACGRTDIDVRNLYHTLTETAPKLSLGGLYGANPDTWRFYRSWHTEPIDETCFSIQNARGYYEELRSLDGDTRERLYASDFIAKADYWQPACCFSSETLVCRENGTFTPIAALRPGDRLRSLSGGRTVAFLSTPRRKGRALYTVNGVPAAFTADHPVLLYDGAVQLKANDFDKNAVTVPLLGFVDQERALRSIPQFGLVQTVALDGAILCGCRQGETLPLPVEQLQEEFPNGEETLLYDVILEPDGRDFDCFLVGTEDNAFYVLTELPFLQDRQLAGQLILALLTTLGQAADRANFMALYPGHPVFGRLRWLLAKRITDFQVEQTDAFFLGIENLHRAAGDLLSRGDQFECQLGELLDLLISELSETLHHALQDVPEQQRPQIAAGALKLLQSALLRVVISDL